MLGYCIGEFEGSHPLSFTSWRYERAYIPRLEPGAFDFLGEILGNQNYTQDHELLRPLESVHLRRPSGFMLGLQLSVQYLSLQSSITILLTSTGDVSETLHHVKLYVTRLVIYHIRSQENVLHNWNITTPEDSLFIQNVAH